MKDKKLYPVCETKGNTIKEGPKHDNPTNDSESAKNLIKHIDHVFTWNILCHASKKTDVQKNLEVTFIALLKLS